MKHVLNIKRLDNDVALPSYAYAGDAGLDLATAQDITIKPFERVLAPTGLTAEIPDGCAGLVLPRSGLAIKQGLTLVNAPGLIDSQYRGEIKVALINLDPNREIHLAKGDRIAQLVIIDAPQVQIREVDELSATSRGSGGFGSSGVFA